MSVFTGTFVDGFRCFQGFTLEGFGPVNLIAGKNSSGKTALLEALFLLSGARNVGLVLNLSAYRGLSQIAKESVSEVLFDPLFCDYDTDRNIKVSGSLVDGGTQEVTLRLGQAEATELELDQENEPEGAAEVQAGGIETLELQYRSPEGDRDVTRLIATEDGLQMRPSPPEPPFPGVFVSARQNISATANAQRYSKLDIEKRGFNFEETLRIIEPRLEKVSTVFVGHPMLYGDIGLDHMIPLSMLGDGLGRLASILLAIADSPDGVVFIDEVENGLHHSIQEKVWNVIFRAADRFNTQIFATTHSYECIESAYRADERLEQEDYLQLFRMELDGNRPTAQKYDREALSGAMEKDIEVR